MSIPASARPQARDADDAVPVGWDENPSSPRQRLPLVALSLVGFGVASYLAAFQLGLVAAPWDPIFGDGTRRVLTSSLSRSFPVPDAAVGAFGYLLDAAAGMIGGRDRWRSMPWIVLVFGFAVGPLGAAGLLLVMAQPLLVGSWCFLCLVSAAISVALIGPAFDEVLAALQALRRARRAGIPLRQALLGRGMA
jgi:hypothetical protein